jgi:hypothetical protein
VCKENGVSASFVTLTHSCGKYGKHNKLTRLDYLGAKEVLCLSSDYRVV